MSGEAGGEGEKRCGTGGRQRTCASSEVVKVEEKDPGSLEEWLRDTATQPPTTETDTIPKYPQSHSKYSNHKYRDSRGRSRHPQRSEGRWSEGTKRLSGRTTERGTQYENRTVNKERSGYGGTNTHSQTSSAVWNERSGRVKQPSHEGEGGERETEDKKRTEDSRHWAQGRSWYGRSEQRPRSGAQGCRGRGQGDRGRGRGRRARGGQHKSGASTMRVSDGVETEVIH